MDEPIIEKLTAVKINDLPVSEKALWTKKAQDSEYRKLVPWIRAKLNELPEDFFNEKFDIYISLTPSKFKRIRKKLKLNQQQLADKLDYTRQSFIQFENGKEPIKKVVCLAMSCLIIEHKQHEQTDNQ